MTIKRCVQYLSIISFGMSPCLSSAQDVSVICDGNYADAAEMLDAAYNRYDTLYSGGEHKRYLNNVGSTIDLYRLWRGLPDQRFRDVSPPQHSFSDELFLNYGETVHERLKRSLPVIHNNSTVSIDIEDKYVAATAADLGTTLGPSQGWWVRDRPDDALTVGEMLTRQLAETDPFVNWLQMILMASDAPWVVAWYQDSEEAQTITALADLSESSFDRFESGQGLEWRVAAAVLAPNANSTVFENHSASSFFHAEVSACSLSPADFAAQSVLRLEELRTGSALTLADREHLPLSLYTIAFRNKVMLATRSSFQELGDPNALHDFVNLAPDAPSLAWLNVARTYYATTVENLIDIHSGAPLDHKTIRALNSLSVDNLLHFASAAERPLAQRRDLFRVAFARLVALERWDEAESLTDTLSHLYPDHAQRLRAIEGQNWPQDVRMTLTVLELPDASVWLTSLSETSAFDYDVNLGLRNESKYGIDLPLEMRTAVFLQRDFEVWLRQPHRWHAFRGMREFSIGALDRAAYRGVQKPQGAGFPEFLPVRQSQAELPFSRLIAWDEISLLGPDNGLSQQISMTLIDWARQGPRYSFLRSRNNDVAKSDALRSVVHLGERNNVRADDGSPIGFTAFAILHSRFANSSAARLTPYWYECSDRCER